MVIAKKYGVLLVMLIIGFVVTGCENVNRRSSVPYAPVDYTLNIINDKLSGGAVLGVYRNLLSVLETFNNFCGNE